MYKSNYCEGEINLNVTPLEFDFIRTSISRLLNDSHFITDRSDLLSKFENDLTDIYVLGNLKSDIEEE